jgi:sugar (pentulose or hexulose) kinase
MEGVAYGSEQNLRLFRENGYDVKEMVICGGAVNSPLWTQIHADVSNVPIVLTEVPEAATLGSAILGAVAAGIYGSIPEAAENMVQVTGRVEPDAEVNEAYQFYFDSYLRTYPAMKDLLNGMVRHVARLG